MAEQTLIPRRRALRLDVIEARRGRRAIAPLAGKLPAWHARVALLSARLDREIARGHLGDLLPDIEALLDQVEIELAQWRAGIEGVDTTGRVRDAELSGASILRTLSDVRARAYGSMQ